MYIYIYIYIYFCCFCSVGWGVVKTLSRGLGRGLLFGGVLGLWGFRVFEFWGVYGLGV